MKTKWLSVVIIGLILLLASAIVSCGQSYSVEDVDVAYETGHADGYDIGSHDGYKLGYEEGYARGEDKSYGSGYKAGENAGYDRGYETGYAEGEDKGYERGYDWGYDTGYRDGESFGYSKGRDAALAAWDDISYQAGYEAGLEYGKFDWEAADFPLDIVSVTSPVSPGDYATLKAKTIPNAACYIGVFYKSGRSEAEGLHHKFADNQGNVSWTWKVGTRTTPGRWMIVVIAYSLGDWEYGVLSTLEDIYFEVK